MARALWKGAISFGLVNVPVELYSATASRGLSFTLLDKRSMDPVGYQRVNKKTGKEVAWGDIVKGYEYEDDRYVVLGDEDFKQANPTASQTVEILGFVKSDSIPSVYFEQPYYLAPGKRGEKVYALLRETMKKADRIAVASVVIQTKQHLAAVIPSGKGLVLNTLRYSDELRDMSSLELPAEGLKTAGVSPREIDMALKLVESMDDTWDPAKYHDTYREDILARVDEKVKAGQTEVVAEPKKGGEPKRTAEVVDLMALLKQSLDKPGARRAQGGAAKAGAKAPPRRAESTRREPAPPRKTATKKRA